MTRTTNHGPQRHSRRCLPPSSPCALPDGGSASLSNWVPRCRGPAAAGRPGPRRRRRRPGGVSATCVSSSGKTVHWGAVPRRDELHRRGGDVVVGPVHRREQNLTATSWTTGTLAVANDRFEVMDCLGSNWQSADRPPPLRSRSGALGRSANSRETPQKWAATPEDR